MSNEKQETIADIVRKMRANNPLKYYPAEYGGGIVPNKTRKLADRIEAAHKREIADEKRISDAVIQSLRDKKLEMAGEIATKDEKIASLRTIIDEFGAVVRITDKDFLKGETECPLYGKAIEEKKNHHWCADCNIGTDGTAVCLFRKCEREVKDGGPQGSL